MPHLRLQVPEEWLREDSIQTTGFDPKLLLNGLVEQVAALRMENPAIEARRQEIAATGAAVTENDARVDAVGKPILPELVPFINKPNLKHAIVPLHYAHMAGDPNKRFLHATLQAGNETAGRTAAERVRVGHTLGDFIDDFVAQLPGVASVIGSITVHIRDIQRDRGYSTTQDRKKTRDQRVAENTARAEKAATRAT
ncbi:MAG: hypothetical protein ABI824_06110 [Acidobacteriota bacterium]